MLARILLSITLLVLAACGNNARAPVEDRVPEPAQTEHIVARGDTLYSIAFRYGLDYRKVAAANQIDASYTIYPGQRLRLEEAPLPVAPEPVPAAPTESGPVVTAYPAARPSPAPTAPQATPTAVAKPAPAIKPSSLPVKPPAPASKPAGPSGAGGKVTAWRWPTSGPVIRKYSASLHKGIDIGGSRGDPVEAVAPGTVVYAGTGIVGMGELLIVKHNDIYLSAYAHNSALLVAEGDNVAAGQTIARKGSSGTDKVKLHFEIRKAGKPIDPQRVLPRR